MSRFINPIPQYKPSSKLYFFNTGTNTQLTTYADSSETTPNTHPVLTDSAGFVPNIFFSGEAKLLVLDENNVQYIDRDPVGGEKQLGDFSAWSALTTYDANDIVEGSDGNYYKSLISGNQDNDPAGSPGSWAEIRFIEVWDETVSYKSGIVVQTADGNMWKSEMLNTGNIPSLENPEYWTPSVNLDAQIAPNKIKTSQFVVNGTTGNPLPENGALESYAIGEQMAFGWVAQTAVTDATKDSNGNVNALSGVAEYSIDRDENDTMQIIGSVMSYDGVKYTQHSVDDTSGLSIDISDPLKYKLVVDFSVFAGGIVFGLSEQLGLLSVDSVEDINIASLLIGENTNLLTNFNFSVATPDNTITPPDATPRSYNATDQIFFNWYVATGGAVGLTYNNSVVNATSGVIYQDVAKTGALEFAGAVTGSQASADLIGTVTGVTVTDEGTDWRISIDLAVAGNVMSGKLENGSFVTGHVALNAQSAIFDSEANPQLTKAWVNFDGIGALSIRDSYNVSSVTDSAVGQYIVNFQNPVRIGARLASVNGLNLADVGGGDENSVTINTYTNTGALADNGVVSFAAFSN